MKFWQLGIILIAAAVVFAPTLGTYFSQDDWVFLSHVYKQPFAKIFDHHSEAFYRPVGQQLFFWIGSGLSGLDAGGFHLLGLSIHLINIVLLWKLLKNKSFYLMLFYAVNPAHFVVLNWLTQVDIEIAVSFGLTSTYLLRLGLAKQGQAFLAQTCGLILYLFGILSHEVVVFLPIVWWIWFKQKRMAVLGLVAGLFLIGAKFLANPFSPNADYTISTNLLGIISSLKWYGLRALFIPEGIRNFPFWLTVGSLIPAVFLILIFRQKLIKGMVFYFLGILPVSGFENHLLAAYAIFGIALMMIELGKNSVIPAQAGIYLNRFRVKPLDPESLRTEGPGMTMVIASVIVLSLSFLFVNFNYSNHWSTTRGIISQKLTEEYLGSDSESQKRILSRVKNYKDNPEIYFSSMSGKQFEVLDKGFSRGIFNRLFYRGNDLTTQFLPDALFFKNSLLAGKFPVWNPWIMAGMPYFLDPQNFLWYPPNYILLLLPLELGFLILLIGHLVLAGWGVKKILNESGVSWRLVLLGMGMFVLSPKIISHIEEGNWSLVIAASWLPFLYWALKNKRFGWTAISLAAIIINNLNIGYYSILFVVIYYLIIFKRPGLATAARPGLKMLKTLIAALILTIPRWLPLALFGNQTVRANLQEAPLPFWSWMKIFKSLFFPLAGSHPLLQNEEILYLGLTPVLLVVIYLVFKGPALLRQGRALFWIVWLGLIPLVAFNIKTPFYFLIKLLPGFSLLRITTRPWIFMSLAMAIFVPQIISRLTKKSKLLAGAIVIAILLEFAYFDRGIFSRRQAIKDDIPFRFYQTMASVGSLTRVYCAIGCLDRLTAQKMGIALLGGNNPIQLTRFVNYLQKAGGFTEKDYFPILPPYSVFNQQPQPSAELLAQTATKFIISPYEPKDDKLKLIDREQDFRLYLNTADLAEYKDHYFNL
ncbi:hypothetical protein HZB78_06005 [Candidatus Collierbacteria bacterium]|nr:hypothetical protein [Candidatus Collierbacteria bacterium]